MMTDAYVVVYPGGEFPKGAVRALSRGLENPESEHCDSFVALWIRDDGEAVFGRAWCDGKGKCCASFPWGGKEVREYDTKGFRVLTYIGSSSKNSFKYRWVKASKVDRDKLVYSGEYVPAVVHLEGEECLGKANWNRRLVWTSCHGRENVHEGEAFDNCSLLCKEPKVEEARR